MPRRAGSRCAARGKKALGDAVLQRMEGDHGEPALRLEKMFRGTQSASELEQFLIEMESQRLKGAGRGVLGFVVSPAKHAGDDVGKLRGPCDRRFLPARDNGPGDRPGPLLLAECADDGGKLALGQLIDEVACGRAGAAPAHVETAVLAEGEAALRLVELHGGDAEIERHAVDRSNSFPLGNVAHLGVAAEHEFQPAGKIRFEDLGESDGAWIAVDGEHVATRRLKEPAAITTGPERSIDEVLAVARLERLNDFGEHHGNVAGRSPRGRHTPPPTPPPSPCSLWPAASAAPRAE